VPALANDNLRRFLRHALDRQRLLTAHFPGGLPSLAHLGPAAPAVTAVLKKQLGHPDFHVALNGPYLPASWACCPAPRVPAALYDPELAKSYARQAHTQLGAIALTLKYPNDDPRLARACKDLADEVTRTAVAAGATIHLKLQPQEPHQLKQALERRDFELAYMRWDYADETYWLWPLFDPHPDAVAAGGNNVFGYDNDAKLQNLFRETLPERRFVALQETTHSIHAHLVDRMPFIPLWQLHEHMAVDARLQPVHLDPLRVFTHVADWKLTP